ncbi:MAG: HIT domain-containing protein [Chthoniobacteraceae bacterium]
MDKTEMRLDPLRQTWTIFSGARVVKPPLLSRGKSEAAAPLSPFSAGNEELTPPALYSEKTTASQPWQVRVIPNRAPMLRVEGDPARHADGFNDRMDGVGAHEIIIEDPGAKNMEDQPLPVIEQIIRAWKLRMLDLTHDPRMRAFFIIKNVGTPAGASSAHPISQLIAMAVIPPALTQKLETARAFYQQKKRSIFEDILTDEIRAGSRLVYENNGFAAFCPYASRTPFEMAIYPKRQCADFHGISDQELSQCADVLKIVIRKLNRALDNPAYNLMVFTAPTRTARRDHWNTLDRDFRWHIEIVPRIDYVGGFELATGSFTNTVWPETAAGYLMKIEA